MLRLPHYMHSAYSVPTVTPWLQPLACMAKAFQCEHSLEGR